MCGILGEWGDADAGRLRAGLACLAHRGPDAHGEWHGGGDGAPPLWLGHRRLSILDLSAEGAQPMHSPSGRWVVVFNGEIFNFRDLRAELEGHGVRFRGHSDTEVLVAAVERWGPREAVTRFVGMFALALYDVVERALWLVRDRMGIKPLYYALAPGRLAFASEMRALRDVPWISHALDADALAAYFRHLCVPAPASIVRQVRKLPAGAIARWDGHALAVESYWSVDDAIARAEADPFRGTFDEATDELDARVRDAVRLRMESDVPLGAFLSGGIDSSLVTAMLQSLSGRPIESFTIGFDDDSHDEAPFARAVAEHLGTRHHERRLSTAEAQALVPDVAAAYDEPFADGSSVPTFLLSRFAREHVTVALSGDGGDELFGGYPRYFWGARIQRWRRRLSAPGAAGVGRALRASPAWMWDGPASWFGGRRFGGPHGLSTRVRRMGAYLAAEPADIYDGLFAAWPDPARLLHPALAAPYGPDPRRFATLDWPEQMMAVDQRHYLPDDILTKVDRASMAFSLEARVPLLDHRLVEWSWRLPRAYKLADRGDRGKLLPRAVLGRYVPTALFERPKQGFGMPMGRWLRAELRPWAEALLADAPRLAGGILRVDVVQRSWREHQAGADRLAQIWTVLMLLQWLAGSGWRAEMR